MDQEQQQEEQPTGWLGYSSPVGLVLIITLLALGFWNDGRAVDAVNSSHGAVTDVREAVAGFAKTEPDDAQVTTLMKELEGIVASGGGAAATPLFGVVGRPENKKVARKTTATALALLARLEVIQGDLDAAGKAAKRFEDETKDEYLPAEVEAWIWRVNELVAEPRARKVDRTQLRKALFTDEPLADLFEDAPKAD